MDSIKKLINEIKELLVYYMSEFPFETGLAFIVIGIFLLIFQLKQNNSFKMSEYGPLAWKTLVGMWALILMSFSFGLILIFRS